MSALAEYFSNILEYNFKDKIFEVFKNLCKNDYLNYSSNQIKEIFIFSKKK